MSNQVLGLFFFLMLLAAFLYLLILLLRSSRRRALDIARREVTETARTALSRHWVTEPVALVAMLCGGAERVLMVQLLHLYRNGQIELDPSGRVRMTHLRPADTPTTRALLHALQSPQFKALEELLGSGNLLRDHFRQITDRLRERGWANARPKPLSAHLAMLGWLRRLLFLLYYLTVAALGFMLAGMVSELLGLGDTPLTILMFILICVGLIMAWIRSPRQIRGLTRSRSTLAGRAARLQFHEIVNTSSPALRHLQADERLLFLFAVKGSAAPGMLDQAFISFINQTAPWLFPKRKNTNTSGDTGTLSTHHDIGHKDEDLDTAHGSDSPWSDGVDPDGGGGDGGSFDGGDGGSGGD
ncbi:hypothetical protein COCCU_05920 [Corynebacterium occultum]|uniref:Uncharacterized protein n=1 Tax=Corynebacterium occultum TaxID=2675219 RepID=A0A6B8WL39_9CORY|nr:TIGR04222 domain-containing membrane protein [Corynebacterium occultum]QGU07128.1 hypothetical protein COCCU_05920 [Corynebacterium occultum]